MKIKIKYFAGLREKAGKSQEVLELNSPVGLNELYGRLSVQYGFPLGPEEIKYAVNNEYVDSGTDLMENDVVAFIPPVAGG